MAFVSSHSFFKASIIFSILAFCFFGFSLTALSLVACTDPGILPKAAHPPTSSNRNVCRKSLS